MAVQTIGADGRVLVDWRPEDSGFWRDQGAMIARRNLWISIAALLFAFAVWMVWSAVVVNLPRVGFAYSADQLFWLAALPGLSGATLRIFYSFMVPIFGGRRWTAISTAALLVPALGIGFAVQDPSTPYWLFLLLALLCGLGGGNFASSMANISFFFPRAQKGRALALNAGLGNLGVSAVQLVVPLVITIGIFGALGGAPQQLADGGRLWLQNAGFIWVPFIAAAAIAAWFGMNDIASAKASFAEQSVIFQRKHNWIMCLLYTGTFGSFIGFSAGFPLLIKQQYPEVDPLHFAFLGPLVGSLARSASGGLADRVGGGRVTFFVFVVLAAGDLLLLFFLSLGDNALGFWGFLATVLLLFAATGVGNASTFQMIPVIFRIDRERAYAEREGSPVSPEVVHQEAEREAAAVIGFTSAIAAYGAFFIPKSFGSSIAMSGGPEPALYGFFLFYVLCIVVTWVEYSGRNAEIRC
ncbi:MAG TPA: NarK family nitrate/nitrite MFS transporter [Geminicoccaceae bacterium]|nr:NarK family nitrate/nitrite MFS transporter [Geminicoccaceae bacterium]